MLGFGLTFLAALVLSLALTPLARKAALKLGIMDAPDSRLKKHATAVPYLGGAAIYLACVASVMGAKMLITGSLRGVMGILGGATFVFILGLVDDIRPLRPPVKMFFQFLAACIPIYFGVHIKFIANPLGALPLTAFWIVGITNAFNLLDIMDGLAGGVAAIASVFFLIIAAQNGRFNDAVLAAGVAGGALGFLAYNRPPARIFMGDAGSMFLGFTLASAAIGLGYSQDTNLGVIAPILMLGVPIFETLFVMTIRWQLGKPVLAGSPDHIALRLRRLGYGVRGTLAVLWGATLVLGALAYAVSHANWERALLIAVAVAFCAVLAAIRLASIKMHA